jgi:gamma-tubulin complex component
MLCASMPPRPVCRVWAESAGLTSAATDRYHGLFRLELQRSAEGKTDGGWRKMSPIMQVRCTKNRTSLRPPTRAHSTPTATPTRHQVEHPLDLFLTPASLRKYSELFQFLMTVRRTQVCLGCAMHFHHCTVIALHPLTLVVVLHSACSLLCITMTVRHCTHSHCTALCCTSPSPLHVTLLAMYSGLSCSAPHRHTTLPSHPHTAGLRSHALYSLFCTTHYATLSPSYLHPALPRPTVLFCTKHTVLHSRPFFFLLCAVGAGACVGLNQGCSACRRCAVRHCSRICWIGNQPSHAPRPFA